MNLQPTGCNICGGKVEYISNDKIYGRRYGSGYCYHCTKCGAYVGTHKSRPRIAFCHFGYFDLDMLNSAYIIITEDSL